MAARFSGLLDTMLLIRQGGADAGGEDSYIRASKEDSALVGVFDGCGGLGARTYPDRNGHTGAYLAARAACGAAWDWYQALEGAALQGGDALAEALRSRIDTALGAVRSEGGSAMRMRGSMVRDFPTTAALALAHQTQGRVLLDLFWAGDSRVYLLDADGLQQLTGDDLEGEDALSNLTHDAAMTNVIALDGRYTLHHRRLALAQPGVVFAATDGVFGYIRTPMEFEWLLLRVLRDAETPQVFTQRLEQILDELAGDDFTLALMSFGFGDFQTLRGTLTPRIPMLERDYVKPLHHGRTDALQAALWAQYRTGYERFLTTKGGGA